MSPRYLTLASLAAFAVSLAILISLFTVSLPSSTGFGPRPKELPIMQYVAQARAYAEAGCSSLWPALLDPDGVAGCKASELELERAERDWRALGSPTKPYEEPFIKLESAAKWLAGQVDDHMRSANTARGVLLCVWMVGLVASVMGFVRSRLGPSIGARVLSGIAVGLLVLTLLLPVVVLVFLSGPLLSFGTLVGLTTIAFGLAIGANLMPGVPHPFVTEYERTVDALPEGERADWLRKKIVLGAVMFLLGVGLTLATLFSRFPIGVVFSGLMLAGFFKGGLALVVAVRRTVDR